MGKVLLAIFSILIALALCVTIALIITANTQGVTPADQWNSWLEAMGFIKKSAEALAIRQVINESSINNTISISHRNFYWDMDI